MFNELQNLDLIFNLNTFFQGGVADDWDAAGAPVNNGTGFDNSLWGTVPSGTYLKPLVGDFDGDNAIDLVAVLADKGLTLLKNGEQYFPALVAAFDRRSQHHEATKAAFEAFGRRPVGTGRVEQTQPMMYSADEACDVGADTGSPASPDYGPTGNKFSGEIDWVQIDLGDDSHDHLIKSEDRLTIALARQ